MTDPYGFYDVDASARNQTGAKRRTLNVNGAGSYGGDDGGGYSASAGRKSVPASHQQHSTNTDWFVYEQPKVAPTNDESGFGSPPSVYANQSQTSAAAATGAPEYFDHSGAGNFYYNQGAYQKQQAPNFFIPTPTSAAINPPAVGQSAFGTAFGFGSSGGSSVFDSQSPDSFDIDAEPPLLEELGINFDHIRQKTFAVLNPVRKADPDVIADGDLAGPLVFCLLFSFSLLLHGKIYFGNIYGTGMLGCLGMYALLNLMADEGRAISLTNTVSVLGYCLLPMALLSMLAAVLSLQGYIGYGVSLAAVIWSGCASSKLFTQALDMHSQLILVAYPCTLLYMAFALLAIF